MCPDCSRRGLLKTMSCGFGYLAFSALAHEAWAAEQAYVSPLAAKLPHFPAKAKRVIFLFMQGGPSHVDTFDYKPKLASDDGKNGAGGRLLPSPFKFKRSGRSGLWISELFPRIAEQADNLCLINSMHTDSPAHPQATIQMHTGSSQFVRPSVGAWLLYGLGTPNQNLPGFMVIDPPGGVGGAQNYGNAFLPAAFQGTRVGSGNTIPDIANKSLTPAQQRRQLDLLQAMNHEYMARSGDYQNVEGVIESFELGFRMESTVPEVMDIGREPQRVQEMYGIGKGGPTEKFGRQCLMARRLAEAGVRFIEIGHGGWDQHTNLKQALGRNALATDQPIAALLSDLKTRGMLKDTLVVWGGEFGRTPTSQGADGRNHNNRGFTVWMAGGGVKGGMAYGSTDEHGGAAVDNKMHIHDLHATILALMGLDHEKLTYRYAGRDFRLTNVSGNVVKEIMA